MVINNNYFYLLLIIVLVINYYFLLLFIILINYYLEADLLSTVCNNVKIELPLQEIREGVLNSGSQNARLVVYTCGFWDRQTSAFLIPKKIYLYVQKRKEADV